MCVPLTNKLINMIKKVLDNTKKYKLHSVELIGGGSRMPSVVNTVKNLLNMEPCRTLNAEECVAQGSSIACAISSPCFQVSETKLVDYYHYNVNIDTGDDILSLFSEGNTIPSIKKLTFTRKENFNLKLRYDNDNPLGT
jgi:heat shock protein 4